jgi:hypothetical protein
MINASHEEPGQFMTNRMRNLGLGPKDVNVLWIYMNIFDEEGGDIRNKVMIVDKTEAVEEKFMVAKKYVDDMSDKMLEHVQFELDIAGIHRDKWRTLVMYLNNVVIRVG